jgi:hypothetical protein
MDNLLKDHSHTSPNPFAQELTLKFRHGAQHSEYQSSGCRASVQILLHRD